MVQQTAVEQLYERLERMIPRTEMYNRDKIIYLEQAKEKDKQQKKDAWVDGNGTQMWITSKEVDECFDDYYNETYGK
jgi:hypothetical protein